jgi:hypothetical protein
MAKTPAERQREYRRRHRERINLALTPHAKAALGRLARHRGETQKAVLEQLIADAERATVDQLADPGSYYDDVTP